MLSSLLNRPPTWLRHSFITALSFTSPENYGLASGDDIVPLPVIQTGCKTRQLSSVQK
jgi:hypothetical protein